MVVLFSVVVQGTLVPRVAERLGVPMTETEWRAPWVARVCAVR